jgi:LPXTG-motif cell wall-anchored protein
MGVGHLTAITALALGALLATAAPAFAQVGYDPTKTVVVLGTAIADANGVASGTFPLPPGTTPGYEVIATGVDPSNQKLSEFATVDGAGTALGTPQSLELASGTQHIALAAYTQVGVVSPIHVTAAGFAAGSTVTFSVRYTPASASSTGPSTTGGPLPLTGSEVGLLVAIAGAVLLVGTGFVTGGRIKRATVKSDD